MFWVVALFDKNTEQEIKAIWEELKQNSISFYSEEVKDARPHLTLGHYYELDKEAFIEGMKTFYEAKGCFEITFNTIGSFLNYQTLFLSPTHTKKLLELHSNHHDFFSELSTNANPYYEPDQWIPHCTLANNLSSDKLSEAFNYCMKRIQTIEGRVEEIALIELVDEEGFDAPIIYKKPLKE
ncbi:2'-5' RNA ligase family protein [Alkalihalobacillus sp. CinArs1]|uniref:2'-5' RNA ligase family protein n=1 Tax=Alkalihalobacillus sp. CinArs1 TaxID=2995314 RepID=UPI0022DE214D|nr:2'-5' RNA ligase family protein [Alkalihalobacillus sp. CinArs1]